MRSVIQAYIHPFKRIGVALLDMLFLLNVITLTLGTLYTIQNDNRFSDQEYLVNASVSITFICFIGIVLWHLLKRLRNNVRIRNKTDQKLASATRVVLGVKLRVKTIMTCNKKGEENEEELPGGQHRTEHSEPAVRSTGTTTIMKSTEVQTLGAL